MEYGNVSGVDKPVSRLVQGTVYFTEKNKDEAFELFDAIFERGTQTFDTAHGYGGGQSEQVLGEWIESRGIRDQVVIVDKGAHPYDGQVRVTPEFITSDLTESLDRLRTDFVEVYILHRDDETKPVGPLVDVLNEHYNAGKIKAFGGSNWSFQRIQEANEYAKANNLQPFTVSSPQFSLAEMVKPPWDGCISIGGPNQTDAQKWYGDSQMPLFTWSSLAGGFMAGRFRRDNLDTFNNGFDTSTIRGYCYEENFQRLDRLEALANKKDATLPQMALAYTFSQPLNIFALTSSLNIEQYTDSAASLTQRLSPEEVAWLELKTDTMP